MRLLKFAAVSAVALFATGGTVMAQAPEGRIYVFHSTAQGGCPALDWHVVAGANGSLSGMIAWNNMQSMARATGGVASGKVELAATEVGGQGRTAMVDGVLRPDGWFTVNIKGPSVDCTGINIPYYVAPASAG